MSAKRNIVVIGASAGGIESLRRLMAGIPDDIAASFFVVQHIGRDSPRILDRILESAGRLPATLAENGAPFAPGHVYVAPPDHHLLISHGRLLTTRGPRENCSRPAIDPLFRSAAVGYGSQVIAVILSGTLDDGTAGLAAVKRCGGVAVVQDPSDALYPEMPQSAVDHVDVDHIVSLDRLPDLLTCLTREPCEPPVAAPRDLVLEARMAEAEAGDQRRTDQIGQLSQFSCPDCGGPLWAVEAGFMERYRCHVGHAFTARALLQQSSEATERALWVALRTMEERSRMLQRLARQERERGRGRTSASFNDTADELIQHASRIRELLRARPERDLIP